jgi:hypothetical protein
VLKSYAHEHEFWLDAIGEILYFKLNIIVVKCRRSEKTLNRKINLEIFIALSSYELIFFLIVMMVCLDLH